jgi:hypothetical protein
MKKTIYTILFIIFAFITYLNLVAFDDGIVGLTKKNGNNVGCVCHGLFPDTRVSVIISGPSTVIVNDTVTYILQLANGPAVAGGCDISASMGTLYTSSSDTSLRRAEEFPGSGFEITHRYPNLFSSDTLEFIFKYVAPSTPNVTDTIFANSNSVNHDTTPDNDRWNYANNFLINIIDNPLPVELSSFVSSVNGNNVTLNWTTATETNNSGFDIERSNVNGQKSNEWIKVGDVAGNGTSTVQNSYSFTDRNLASGNYNYRLKQIDFNGNFEYFNLSNQVNVGVPTKFDLSQNYPNPFNPSTQINYDLPSDGKVSIKLFDMSGKEVATLVNEVKTGGYYSVNFNASSLSSGVYFYTFTANNFIETKKMLLLK